MANKVIYTGRIVYSLEKNNQNTKMAPVRDQIVVINGTKTRTDRNGCFSVKTEEFKLKKVYVEVYAQNDLVKVRAKGKVSAYAKKHTFTSKDVVGHKIPQIHILGNPENDVESRSVVISQRLLYAFELLYRIGWKDKDSVQVVYPLKNVTYDFHNHLYIQEQLYDDDTLFHEFGHSIAFKYKFMASAYYTHYQFSNRMVDCYGKAPISKKECTQLTFNEGFANFFARMVKTTFKKELGVGNVDSYDENDRPLDASKHKYFGEVMEECVESVLYEMIDENFERYYPSECKNNPASIDFKKLMNWIRDYGTKYYKSEHFSGFVGFIREKYKMDYTRMFNLFEKYGFAIRNITFTSKTRTFKFENGGDNRPNARAASVPNKLLCNIYNPSNNKWYQIKDFDLDKCTCQIPLNIYIKLDKKFKCYFSCSQVDKSKKIGGLETGPYFTEDHWFTK